MSASFTPTTEQMFCFSLSQALDTFSKGEVKEEILHNFFMHNPEYIDILNALTNNVLKAELDNQPDCPYEDDEDDEDDEESSISSSTSSSTPSSSSCEEENALSSSQETIPDFCSYHYSKRGCTNKKCSKVHDDSICSFFLNGRCSHGSRCTKTHPEGYEGCLRK